MVCCYACNAYIKSSYFKGLSYSSGNGGALYVTSITKLLIELSMFIECEASGYGGCIYMSGGNCILYMVCGVKSSISGGQGVFLETTGMKMTNVIETTVTHCECSSGGYPVDPHGGTILCKSVNLSQNHCYRCSALYCYPTSNGQNIVCSLCYSSLSNNTADDSNFLMFEDFNGAYYEVNNTNIINNKQIGSTYGLIRVTGTTTMKHVSILGNTGSPIFSGSITLINCATQTTSGVTTQSPTESFLNYNTLYEQVSVSLSLYNRNKRITQLYKKLCYFY